MELPKIGDGTVMLRPFSKEDGDAAIDWLSGPKSRERSATDGGPSADEELARSLVEDLKHSTAWTILLEEDAIGWVNLRTDGKGTGHIQIVLSEPQLWIQGIGSRALRLVVVAAFDHLAIAKLCANGLPENAEAARVAFEDAGFGITRRYIHDGGILLNVELEAVCHQTSEQRIFLIHHGRTSAEAEGRILGSAIDTPLDEVGRAQAEAMALSGLLHSLSECVSSPQQRAAASADQAFAARDIPCTHDDHWIDRDWGNWSGQPVESLARDEAGNIDDPPSGESDAELCARVSKALDGLPFGGHLAVVTHGSVIAAILRQRGSGIAEAPGLRSGTGIPHGSITELRRGPTGWRIIRIGDDRHQQARRATADLVHTKI